MWCRSPARCRAHRPPAAACAATHPNGSVAANIHAAAGGPTAQSAAPPWPRPHQCERGLRRQPRISVPWPSPRRRRQHRARVAARRSLRIPACSFATRQWHPGVRPRNHGPCRRACCRSGHPGQKAVRSSDFPKHGRLIARHRRAIGIALPWQWHSRGRKSPVPWPRPAQSGTARRCPRAVQAGSMPVARCDVR